MTERGIARCRWCGKLNGLSEWEQETLAGDWAPLCVRCAPKRLNNPLSALLPLRRSAP